MAVPFKRPFAVGKIFRIVMKKSSEKVEYIIEKRPTGFALVNIFPELFGKRFFFCCLLVIHARVYFKFYFLSSNYYSVQPPGKTSGRPRGVIVDLLFGDNSLVRNNCTASM